jgi:uncharacterized protein YydD (DUF2326 family)
MIRFIRANRPGFRSVDFEPGFNLVLAQRAAGSSERDSTNALGKSAIVDLIHYGLGSEPKVKEEELPRVQALAGWAFSYGMEINGADVEVGRSVDEPGELHVHGAPRSWGGRVHRGVSTFKVREWTTLLGQELFGLVGDSSEPSFRQLIRYFVRYRDKDFLDAFGFVEGSVWAGRIAAAWLLGLNEKIPAAMERLAAEEKAIRELKKHAGKDVLVRLGGDRPKLEAERERLTSEVARLQADLEKYQVHEQYADLERRANVLTERLATIADENLSDDRLAQAYEEGMRDAPADTSPHDVVALYREAGIWFPERVTVRLSEVQTFHEKLLVNRRAFLSAEVDRLRAAIAARRSEAARLDAERSGLMKILTSHRALEHFSKLDQHLATCRAQLAEVRQRLATLEQFEQTSATLKSQSAQVALQARREHDERAAVRGRAQRMFSELVREMFHEEGRLIIDDSKPAYEFKPDIPSIGSGGVSQLATACVDLTLARLHAERGTGPRLLVHDSRMFHGMDPRQRGAVLAKAFSESERFGYRYVALLNESEFQPCVGSMPAQFSEQRHVRLRLHDHDASGSLFGFRFRGRDQG